MTVEMSHISDNTVSTPSLINAPPLRATAEVLKCALVCEQI